MNSLGIWKDTNKILPELITTGCGLQIEITSVPVLVKNKSGVMGVCTFHGDGWNLLVKEISGGYQMYNDTLIYLEDICGWMDLPS